MRSAFLGLALCSAAVGARAKAAPPTLHVAPLVAPASATMPLDEPEAVISRAELAQVLIWRAGERTDFGQRVRSQEAVLDVVVRYHVEAGASTSRKVVLLAFADALADDPGDDPAFSEIETAKVLHGPFRAGKTEIVHSTFAGNPVTARWRPGSNGVVEVMLPVGGHSGILDLRVHVTVPRRFWPFGCARSRCAAAGAGAPLPSVPAKNGPFGQTDARVVLPVPWTAGQVAFARPGCHSRSAGCRPDTLLLSVTGLDTTRSAPYPLLIWGKGWHHERQVYHGVNIEWFGLNSRPGARYPRLNLLRGRKDVAGHAFDLARSIIDIVDQQTPRVPAVRHLLMVQGPLRTALAQPHGQTLLVSDAALQVVSLPRFARFHRQQIARGISELFAFDWLSFAQDPSDWVWSSGMLGMHWLEAWSKAQIQRQRNDEDAEDILAKFTFFPFVDRFLYAGQSSFGGTYFRSVEDEEPLRVHPLRFANDLPQGRRLHEKLSELLTSAQLDKLYQHLIEQPTHSVLHSAEAVYGRQLQWFFDQWQAHYPSVDYAVKSFKSAPSADPGEYVHEVVITRAGERGVVEPVQVYAREDNGHEHFLVWNGEAAPGASLAAQPAFTEHTWRFSGRSRLRSVWLDPRTRLHEEPRLRARSWESTAAADPKFNNRKPALPRFIYTGIGLDIAASELSHAKSFAAKLNAINGYAFFQAGLRRDLRRVWTFDLQKGRENLVGFGSSLAFAFGEKSMANRRRARLRLSFGIDWLSDLSLDRRGGIRLTQGIGLSDDTRRAIFRPETGRALALAFGLSEVFRSEGVMDHRIAWSVGASWVQLLRLAHGHVLAASASGGLVLPVKNGLEYRSLRRGGGVDGLSAYTADELFARAVAEVRAEYRHVFFDDLRLGLAGLLWWRDLGGSLGAGVATISSCESLRGWFHRPDSWYGQVSYGLSSVFDVLGMAPQMVRLEVAVPLVRRDRTCLGERFPDYLAQRQGLDPAQARALLPPYSLTLTFFPSF